MLRWPYHTLVYFAANPKLSYQPTDLCWKAPIARWSGWNCARISASTDATSSPDISFVEPMLRRRLSSLAKMSLKVAHDCANDQPNVRFVYASRHGELSRTTSLLDTLATGEVPSPTAFSLSVLNATPGLFSILRHDMSPATAISAAGSSFGFGMLEAALQYADDPRSPVLFVYADEPVPTIYGVEATETGPAHALAVLISDDSTLGPIINYDCQMARCEMAGSDEQHSFAFVRSLTDSRSGVWQGEGRRWVWEAK
jgi:hypothetical protein